MPGLSGIETLQRMSPPVRARTIIISSHEYDEDIYSAVKAGAQGFVHKEADAAEIFSAVRAVGRGKQAFSTRIRERLANNQLTAGLSSREIEVLHLVALGLTNKEVGRTLNISQFTVRNHLNHISQKRGHKRLAGKSARTGQSIWLWASGVGPKSDGDGDLGRVDPVDVRERSAGPRGGE